ncbi:39S ribosomal protein L50, mitochondrial-like [Eriocheir sinensis]|uniref:39S ribosomal protein L50, mitochondrial-like n=1 Tax=Eriocheir sinensis TaxID=95602 RepID=UPI0021C59E95|nr:39S ribosomal protein L50, mitochondrial-like [Eriocheir sinensis]
MAAPVRGFRLLLPRRPAAHTPARPFFSPAKDDKPGPAPASASPEEELDVLPADRKLDFDATSLAARGYLRSQKPYKPPGDAGQKVLGICERVLGTQAPNATFPSAQDKWKVLTQCSQALGHTLPNSLLHRVTSVEELVTFYLTPVNTTVPLDMMKDMDLPKNLHVTYNYTRFHPETDTKFGGVSVFTKDSTLVVGLKNKKRYPGYNAETSWPSK